LRCGAVEQIADGIPKFGDDPSRNFSQQRFQLGEGLLDRD
jgi:hypothetical protein